MYVSKKRSWMSLVMALMILVSAFAPMSAALALDPEEEALVTRHNAEAKESSADMEPTSATEEGGLSEQLPNESKEPQGSTPVDQAPPGDDASGNVSSTPAPVEGEGSSSVPAPVEGEGSSSMPAPVEGEGSSSVPAPVEGQGSSSVPALVDPGQVKPGDSTAGLHTGVATPLGVPMGPLGVGSIDVTTVLQDIIANITQDGKEIPNDNSVSINGVKPIAVKFSFKVPVEGDGGEGPFVKKGDFAQFPLSSSFKINLSAPIELKFGIYKVGEVSFETDLVTKMVTARVDFDGDDIVFAPVGGESVNSVEVKFDADLQFSGYDTNDPWGDTEVTLLDKVYTVNVDTDQVAYKIKKDAEEFAADRQIKWKVKIEAVKSVTIDGVEHTKNLDLFGYTFKDALASVGDYVDGSFEISEVTPDPSPNYDATTKILSYTFGESMTSPKEITFKTRIPDSKYFAGSIQSISNKAELTKGGELIAEGSATHLFTPPIWITKGGKPSGEMVGGNYDPSNRLITWEIIFNHAANALNGVKIIDVLPSGLMWQSAKLEKNTDSDLWVDSGLSWSSQPANGEYEVGDISYKGKLTIVTKVVDTGAATKEITFKNAAAITWADFPLDTVGSDRINSSTTSVKIGYPALIKSGERIGDAKDRKIAWTVKFDPKGQVVDNLKVFDLLVYKLDRAGDRFNINTVTGIPTGIDRSDLTPRYGQKYINDTFIPTSPLTKDSLEVIAVMQGAERVADLLVITLPSTGVSEFKFQSEVVDPELFAKNTSGDLTKVYNTVSLFQNNKIMTDANGVVPYNSSMLSKELLHRNEVAEAYDFINPNNSATNIADGFHYNEKAAIFRLSVNADGLNWPNLLNGQGNPWGDVTVTDTLPAEWVFDRFSNGAQYLVYEAEKEGSALKAKSPGTPVEDVTDLLAADFGEANGKKTATFTFTNLDKPYIILVRAKPTDEKLTAYLKGATQPVTEKNNLGLKVSDWNGISTSHDVSVNLQALSKTPFVNGLPSGVIRWDVKYNPYNLVQGNKLEDTLPIGIDLRIDANGMLLIPGNITAFEITVNADGSYTQGDEIVLKQEGADRNIWYDTGARTLHFIIPDSNKAYSLSYITDVTTTETGWVSNQIKLLQEHSSLVTSIASFSIEQEHGNATMQRSGWIQIQKQDASNQNLPGAVFTLYAKDSNKIIRQGTSNSSGIVRMMALPEGEYRLVESAAAEGYLQDDSVHTVKVEKLADGKIRTSIDGATDANAHMLTVKNFRAEDPVGTLMIEKIVAGAGDIPERTFDFTLNLREATGNYTCQIINTATGGVLRSQELDGAAPIKLSLAHGERAIIKGLPVGTTYVVSEEAVAGYVTEIEKPEGNGEIVQNVTTIVKFTNYMPGSLIIRKEVEGDAGDINKGFDFTVDFKDIPHGSPSSYSYEISDASGASISSGTITSGKQITLKHGETAAITGLPKGTSYEIREEDYLRDGYTTIADHATGVIAAGVKSEAKFTNTKRNPGTLTIQKEVKGLGDGSTQSFDFTVIFTNAVFAHVPETRYPYKGTGIADGTIKSGESISLSHGQSIEIDQLPPDTRYEVIEADYLHQGYVVETRTKSGTIGTNSINTAAFVNYKPGNLTITKTVDGNAGDLKKKFDFVVSFKGTTASFPYTGVGVDSGTIKSGDTISLAHGESITVTGLPKEIIYHVTESDYRRDGYVTTATGADGAIIAGGEQRAEFINTRNWYPSDEESTGTLVIKKTVTGRQGDQEQAFTFVVEFEGTYDNSFYYTGSKSGHIKSGQRISLAHGEQVEISGIPVGTAFKVIEVEANQDGYYSTSTGASGKMGELGRTANFVNTKSGVPNTGDDASNGLAKVGLVFFTAALGALIGLDIFLRRKENGNETL